MSRAHRDSVIEPRGLSREDAAAYIGIGHTLFDRLVVERLMPAPKKIRGRNVWDRKRVDEAFDRLPGDDLLDTVSPKEEVRWEDVE
jgi:predicted DNA-binding transcriptional regulator AlpA